MAEIPLNKERLPKPVHINKVDVDTLLDPSYGGRNRLLSLFTLGYGLPLISNGNSFDEQQTVLKTELDHAPIVYVAENEDREVLGTMYLRDLTEIEEFNKKLKEESSELSQAIITSQRPILAIRGIVVDPQHRGNHIARQLYESVVAQENPAGFIGETNREAAIEARRKSLHLLGYRTTYYGYDLTPGKEKPNTAHGPLAHAFLVALPVLTDHSQDADDFEDDLLGALDPSYLPIERLAKFDESNVVHKALQQLNIKQSEIGTGRTVVSPLVSLHEDFLQR